MAVRAADAADAGRRVLSPRPRAPPIEAPPVELALLAAVDALVRIDAPANTSELADIDPALIARVGRRPRRADEAAALRRWCGTLAADAGARRSRPGMGEREYAAFVTRALFLDRPDPVGGLARAERRRRRG